MIVSTFVTCPEGGSLWSPSDGGEAALDTASLLALWTIERLAGLADIQLSEVAPPTRAALEAVLQTSSGLAAWCHGGEFGLYGRESAVSSALALDADNVHLARGQWIYAFACRAGDAFGRVAAAAGVTCFAGYESALYMELDRVEMERLPKHIMDEWRLLVSEAATLVAAGQVDVAYMKRRLFELSAPVLAWCDEHPGQFRGLEILAQQLVNRLVVHHAI